MAVKLRKGSHRKPYQVKYRDANGRRRSKQFRLKKEAEAWNIRTGGEMLDGIHIPERETVAVAEAGRLWIAAAKAADPPLQKTTLVQYQQHLDMHIAPFIGFVSLAKLTLPVLCAFDDRLREEGRSAIMRQKVMVSLSSILANAQKRGLVARNVARDRSRFSGGGQWRRRRLNMGIDIPLPAEIKTIVATATGRWRPILLTVIFTGLRSSELRGLRWQDVDLDGRWLHVKQRADRWGIIDRPKSEAGERSVPLPPILLNTLREWKLACPKVESDLVFATSRGRPETHSNIVNRGLKPLLIAAGIYDTIEGRIVPRYTGLHCFRHWYASWCLNRREDGGLGLPYKTVQSRMGHATLGMTTDTYGHLFPERDDHDALAAGEMALLGG